VDESNPNFDGVTLLSLMDVSSHFLCYTNKLQPLCPWLIYICIVLCWTTSACGLQHFAEAKEDLLELRIKAWIKD